MMPSLGGSLHHLIPREFAFTSAKDLSGTTPRSCRSPALLVSTSALSSTWCARCCRPETAGRIVGTTIERFGRANTLVNNAGAFLSKPFVDYSEADFAAMVGGESRRLFPRLATRGGGARTEPDIAPIFLLAYFN
jgi:NAD(P)-dependent dehydrogenase (short-subunit alcohol dehydrogenase family)